MANLCTLEEAKHYTKVSPGFTSFDSLFTPLIEPVSERIKTYCRRNFEKQQYTEYFATFNNRFGLPRHYWLREWPIDTNATFTVKLSYNRKWSDTDALVMGEEEDDYTYDAETGKLTLTRITSKHPRALQVVYTGGYTVSNNVLAVPSSVKEATALQIGYLVERLANQQAGQTGEEGKPIPMSLDSGAVTGLIPEVRSLLSAYVRTHLGSY